MVYWRNLCTLEPSRFTCVQRAGFILTLLESHGEVWYYLLVCLCSQPFFQKLLKICFGLAVLSQRYTKMASGNSLNIVSSLDRKAEKSGFTVPRFNNVVIHIAVVTCLLRSELSQRPMSQHPVHTLHDPQHHGLRINPYHLWLPRIQTWPDHPSIGSSQQTCSVQASEKVHRCSTCSAQTDQPGVRVTRSDKIWQGPPKLHWQGCTGKVAPGRSDRLQSCSICTMDHHGPHSHGAELPRLRKHGESTTLWSHPSPAMPCHALPHPATPPKVKAVPPGNDSQIWDKKIPNPSQLVTTSHTASQL